MAVLGNRCRLEQVVAGQRRHHHIGTQDIGHRQRKRRGLHIADIEGFDVGGVIEDVAELAGEPIDLVVGQLEPGEVGHMDHIVASDAFGHGAKGYAGDPSTLRCVSPHRFLSPQWIEAVREIRSDYADRVGAPEFDVAANVTVTGAPFGPGQILGHIDASGPTLTIEEGHLPSSDFLIEIPYQLARKLFIDRDPAQVMPALMGGQVKLTGDSSKILLLAGSIVPPSGDDERVAMAREVLKRIDSVTE